jgi:hypothetical protein
MRQQNNHLSHEIQTLFFLQPHFKIFEFFNFRKIFLGCYNICQKVSLDAKISRVQIKSWAEQALETVNCCAFLKRRLIGAS